MKLEMKMEFRQCLNESCDLRFPAAAAEMKGDSCPRCGGITSIVYTRKDSHSPGLEIQPEKGNIVAVLDNIRSAYNVGSLIRTADGAGLSHLYFCGITAPPDHPRVAKTALGSADALEISQHANGYLLCEHLIQAGYYLLALESEKRAISIFDKGLALSDQPLALVIGNEISGIDPGILDLCHLIIELPMMGVKQSLNVVVSFGIAVYHLRYFLVAQ